MGEQEESVEKYKVVVVVVVVVEKRSNEPVVKFFYVGGRRAVPRHVEERVSHNRSREVLYVFPCRLSENNESCHAGAWAEKANERSPLFREGGNAAHGRACEPKRPLSLSLPLPLHILYTLYERAPQLLHMLLCGQILDISQGGDIKSAIARSGCGLGVRLTTVTNGRVLARLSPFGLITRGEKIER